MNDLIETCKNGELGFQACAERAQSPDLQSLFRQRSVECRESAATLQSLVLQYGGRPETDGTTAGAMHRGWTNLRANLTDSTDEILLNECERGEDEALATYRKATSKNLPPRVAQEVQRQLEGVQSNHDQIKLLRNQERATNA
ncbi:MAG: PA2169 family four-helix-bundle protein [Pseudomonadota bacterium]